LVNDSFTLELSQLLEIFALLPDDRLGAKARVDATTASSAYGRLQSASTSDPMTAIATEWVYAPGEI